MTAISRLLKQKSNLCERAVAQTRDVNEGYIVVHNVMAKALARVDGAAQDLGPALARALDLRTKRRLVAEA